MPDDVRPDRGDLGPPQSGCLRISVAVGSVTLFKEGANESVAEKAH